MQAVAVDLAIPEPAGQATLIDEILFNRGITRADLDKPTLKGAAMGLHDMPKAVELIKAAIENGVGIGIYGDYDTDGGTAGVELWHGLRRDRYVSGLQEALGVRPSGFYDESTQKSVRRLQKARGLVETGICDQATWSALLDGELPVAYAPRGLTLEERESWRSWGPRVQEEARSRLRGMGLLPVIDEEYKSSANVLMPYIPRRDEGYGLTIAGVDALKAQGAGLIITVDNGTTAKAAVAYAKSLGMVVVVTDHHPAHEKDRSEPDALVNPQIPGEFDFPYFAGAGVAFLLLRALTEANIIGETRDLISYGAVGTEADVMPMYGPNRTLVFQGLQQRYFSQHVGLWALYLNAIRRDLPFRDRNVLWKNGRIPSVDITFEVAPRINAAGRMEKPNLALELLTTQSPRKAARLVQELEELNRQRKELQAEYEKEAIAMVEAMPEDQYAIVVTSENWKHGIIGPVASRLAERYHRPVYIGAIEADGRIKGSARTGAPVSCREILDAAKTKMNAVVEVDEEVGSSEERLSGGGHEAACGFGVHVANLAEFTGAIEVAAKELMGGLPGRVTKTDDAVWRLPNKGEVDGAVLTLEPYGKSFPQPVIVVRDVKVMRKQGSVTNPDANYCRLRISDGERVADVVCFDKMSDVSEGDHLAAIRLKMDGQGLKLEGQVVKATPVVPSPGVVSAPESGRTL